MSIKFTQYLRPDGRPRAQWFDAVTPEVEQMAARLVTRGYRFEAEMLTTGEVSLTVSDGEDDIAIQVCANGPGIEMAVEKLVREADEAVK